MIKNSRILIVDDIVDNIRVVMNILKEDSYDFSFAYSGIEALRLIFDEAEAFDLILLDIMMPGMNGFEVCQKLKENLNTCDIPIIFLTAKVDIDSITQGFQSGGVTVLPNVKTTISEI
jgi:putative two-component system response regulator